MPEHARAGIGGRLSTPSRSTAWLWRSLRPMLGAGCWPACGPPRVMATPRLVGRVGEIVVESLTNPGDTTTGHYAHNRATRRAATC